MFHSTPSVSTSARVKTIAATATHAPRPRARWSAFLAASGLALLLGTFGCEGPCDSLAEKICSCELNSSLEQSCLLRVQRVSDREVSIAEEERCELYLDTCTCEAIDREDFGQCGITNADATEQM